MRNEFLLFLAKINFIYPNYLGLEYIQYKYFLKRNYLSYDNTSTLIESVNAALMNIPYYQQMGIKNINSVSAFENAIPFIDKDIVRKSWESFLLPRMVKNKVVEGTTGGTWGRPLKLIIPKNRHVVELNTKFSMWEKAGWKGDIRADITTKHLKPNQVFSVDPIRKEVIFDGYNTDDVYYEKIYNVLKLYSIQFIHAYPSSAYQFSLFLKKKNKDTSFIKGFLCGSEGLTELQRQLISKDLQMSVYNWYGHSEKLVLGGPCKHNDALHVEPTYGYFELIDDQGNNIKKEGQVGEIVGTSLHNPYMPMLRYRTGDFAEYAGGYCPHCKRYLPLIRNIQGRRDINKIYLSDGTYVATTVLNLHSDLYTYINGMQFVQNRKGFLEIYLVKGEGFSDTVESRFQEHFNLIFADKCEYEIIYRKKLIKEKNGKFLPLRQFIKD